MATQGESVDAFAAAVLVTQGKTQNEIATELDLSQSAGSRLLKGMETYIQISRSFRWDLLDASLRNQVQTKLSRRQITERLGRLARDNGKAVPTVHVVPLEGRADEGA